MTVSSRWESYFYPETYDPSIGSGTLRNLFDERDYRALRVIEYGMTARRQWQLSMDPSSVSRTYDAEHVCAIHEYLFQDVYEWAGRYRTVNMSKGMSSFADVMTAEVDRYLRDARDIVVRTQWGQLDHDGFASAAAATFAYLNQAHPFREGNGRTSKVFMEHVAENSRFTLDYARVTPELWNIASMLSGPDLGAYAPQPDSLVPVFRCIAIPRTAAPALDLGVNGMERTPAPGQRRGANRDEAWYV